MKIATAGYLLPLLFLGLHCTRPAPPKMSVAAAAPPNILFILTDDQGIGDLSLHGNDSIRTPHLDALLSGAARFTRFYVSPVCAPTRASFLSGQYHPRTGAVFVTRRRETMSDSIVTVAEHLRAAGYRTGLYGKWHNGATFPYHPGGQGFDEFLGFTLGHFDNYFAGELRDERDVAVPFAGDLTGILTDSAAHFMLSSPRPFFCMLAYQAPHTPVQVTDAYWDRKRAQGLTPYNAGIYAMIERIDDGVGKLLAQLEKAGKLDNTIVVFSTDNGPNGDRYRMGLRGTKGQIDEGGVRVPFGIRLPGDHPANGRVFSTPAAHIDLLPTLLELVGRPVPTDLDGVSLVPLLNGGDLADRYIFAFQQGYDYRGYPGSMRNERYLYVRRSADRHEVYDLLADPGQTNDLGPEGAGNKLAARYWRFARSVARPDRVAPPVDLDAAPATVRLLAHEGEPRGATHFRDPSGWANDFFEDLGPDGAFWPITTDRTATYRLRLRYHLAADAPRALRIVAGTQTLDVNLSPARTERSPVPDRVARKEVYPRNWAETELGTIRIPAGTSRLEISGAAGDGLWIKALHLDPLR